MIIDNSFLLVCVCVCDLNRGKVKHGGDDKQGFSFFFLSEPFVSGKHVWSLHDCFEVLWMLFCFAVLFNETAHKCSCRDLSTEAL